MNLDEASKVRICASVGAEEYGELEELVRAAKAEGADLIEVRIDYLSKLDRSALSDSVESFADRLVLTCRPRSEGGHFSGSERTRLEWLQSVSTLRPKYLDLELSTIEASPRSYSRLKESGSRMIVSWHNFTGTPEESVLQNVLRSAERHRQLSKIVTMATTLKDNLRLLSLYSMSARHGLLAFCMGELGLASRLLSPLLGAPFVYASPSGKSTAPGQISIRKLRSLYAGLKL